MKIIGFTGTQHGMTQKQKDAVTMLLQAYWDKGEAKEFRHGDCVGADEEAHKIAKKIGYTVIIHPPKIDTKRAYCRADKVLPPEAYLIRNAAIVTASDVVIATPQYATETLRSGTWATVRYARKANKHTLVIEP